MTNDRLPSVVNALVAGLHGTRKSQNPRHLWNPWFLPSPFLG